MVVQRPDKLQLGLGLVSIGRTWGFGDVKPPNEGQALALLSCAVGLGITVFDTAPAYATSEAILGRFLAALSTAQRTALMIMTKAGEHWNGTDGGPFVDHTIDALKRSIDNSLSLLGAVDVLQIHKASEEVVNSPGVIAAIDHARTAGVKRFGASVSTVEAGIRAIETGLYSFLQFPLNTSDQKFLSLLPRMAEAGVVPIINRPFGMGELVAVKDYDAAAKAAFGFIQGHVKAGIALTGTSKPRHLRENVASFAACRFA